MSFLGSLYPLVLENLHIKKTDFLLPYFMAKNIQENEFA